MSTLNKVDTSILEELDLDTPPCCDKKVCDDQAVVSVCLRHSTKGCGRYAFLNCQRHYEEKIDKMAIFLTNAAGHRRCAQCGQVPTGTVSQNMMVVWL